MFQTFRIPCFDAESARHLAGVIDTLLDDQPCDRLGISVVTEGACVLLHSVLRAVNTIPAHDLEPEGTPESRGALDLLDGLKTGEVLDVASFSVGARHLETLVDVVGEDEGVSFVPVRFVGDTERADVVATGVETDNHPGHLPRTPQGARRWWEDANWAQL